MQYLNRVWKSVLTGSAVLILAGGLAGCGSSSSSSTTPAIEDPPTQGDPILEGQPRGAFVGSTACQTCHAGHYAGWAETVHGDMIRVAGEETIIPEAKALLEDLMATAPNDPRLEIKGGSGSYLTSMDDVVYVVGGKWKQRYVVKTDEGHVFVQGQFYDTPDSTNPRIAAYASSRIYEDRCLECHSTGFDVELANNLDRSAADYTLGSIVTELGVGCEKCHGGGVEHVAAPSKANILNPVDFTMQQRLQFCGSCHGRNSGHASIAGREDALGFQLGDENLHEVVKMLDVTDAEGGNVWHKPGVGYFAGQAAGASQRFYDDGASRSHRQQYNDLLQGPHAGKLTCTSCHNVHAGNTLKAATPVALCASCHDGDMAPGRVFTQEDIDIIMEKRARSTNVPDISTHTFRYGGLGKPADDVPLTQDAAVLPDLSNVAYVGSQTCNFCHSGQHSGWAGTVHGDMIRTFDPAADQLMGTARQLLLDLMANDPTNPLLEIRQGSGNYLDSLDDILYTVGGKWKQRFVVKTDDGHVFVQGQFYDSPDGTDPRLAPYASGRVYEDRCLACHATGFDLAYSEAIRAETADIRRQDNDYALETVVAELGVGCEACHGPGQLHVQGGNPDWIINPKNFKRAAQVEFCGSCHGRNSAHNDLAGREDAPGFQLGDKVEDHVKILSVARGLNVWEKTVDGITTGFHAGPAAGASQRFYADGASRSHRQQYNDLEQGPKKGMTCTDCHNVHNSAEGSYTLKKPFAQLCADCHGTNHGYLLDDVMPKRARSTNLGDIRTHTFIRDAVEGAVGNPAEDIPLTEDSN
jgi:predicted CXXCH cytochrome family protein